MAALRLISTVLNIIQTVLSIALASVSMWFFVELKNIIDLRNKDRYLLDFTLYWPQVLPWIFLVISIIIIFVNICGFYGICKKNKSTLYVYVVFLSLVTLAAFAAGIVGLTCADSKTTDDFISGAVSDAYSEMKIRKEVIDAFGNIERRLRCCGIKGSSDYTHTAIPESCCDRDETVACENSASRRLGCAEVAVPYTRMFMKFTSVGALVIACISVGSLIVAILLVRSRRNKADRFKSEAEQEMLKVPL
ncbi:hypothetical protein ABMA28_010418 [Loxostege sticticalis]|uniref:Tetraspanin n=1 Tax=Loxostege sticticalis TaxID=481309 RepID=A0ABD0S860_LOXSC